MRWAWMLAMAAVLGAGCSSPEGAPPVATPTITTVATSPLPSNFPTTIDAGTDPFVLRPQLLDCDDHTINVEAPMERIDARLPEGFRASGTGEPATGTVMVTVVECESAILDNATVLGQVRLAFISAFVFADESVQGNSDVQLYVWEIYSSDSSVAAVFQAVGLPASLATLEVSDDAAATTFSVTVGAAPVFSGVGGNGGGDTFAGSTVQRMHYMAVGGQMAVDRAIDFTSPQFPGPGTVQAQGGVLSGLAPADGRLAGVGAALTSRGSLVFLRADDLPS